VKTRVVKTVSSRRRPRSLPSRVKAPFPRSAVMIELEQFAAALARAAPLPAEIEPFAHFRQVLLGAAGVRRKRA